MQINTFMLLAPLVLCVCVGTKGTLYALPNLQNNELVPQVIERGCKPVLLCLTLLNFCQQNYALPYKKVSFCLMLRPGVVLFSKKVELSYRQCNLFKLVSFQTNYFFQFFLWWLLVGWSDCRILMTHCICSQS